MGVKFMEKKRLAPSIQQLKEGITKKLSLFRRRRKGGWLGLVSVGLMVVVTVGGLFYLATDWSRPGPDADPNFYWAEPLEPIMPAEPPAVNPVTPVEPVEPKPTAVIQPPAPAQPGLVLDSSDGDPGPEPEEVLVPVLASDQAFTDLISPVEGMVTSSFGWYQHPVFADWRYNPGLDFEAELGTEVKAVLSGTVAEMKEDGIWGKTLIIDHGAQRRSVYGCLGEIEVEPKQAVEQGQVIGTVGKTGANQQPQLHLELRHGGTALDPESYLSLN